jgi:putative nucleotidyltransferase with HDIG domain
MADFRFTPLRTPEIGEGPDFNELWSLWPDRMAALDNCPQDPSYHAEGDAGIHTRLVVEAMTEMAEWQRESEVNRFVLFWASVLHDIGKPATTVTEADGRIRAPNHSRIGAQIAREILYKDNVDYVLRERICSIILGHQRPFHFMNAADPEREIARLSYTARIYDLAMHAEADLLGREGDGIEAALESVEMMRSIADDQGCLRSPYPFENDGSRMGFFHEDKPLSYVPYEDYGSEVIMLYGLPGSGKDTWIESNAPDLPVISTDALREEMGIKPDSKRQGEVIQAAKECAREYLRKKQSFIYNATNIDSRIRKPFLDLFRNYGARIVGVNIEVGYDDWLRQNRDRPHAEVVPDAFLQKSVARMEPISLREAHEVKSFTQRFDHGLNTEEGSYYRSEYGAS